MNEPVTRDYGRKLILPPTDRAHWRAPANHESPLQYLAWGERQYGQSPIPATRHDGWCYVVVEAGNPHFVSDTRSETIHSPTLAIIGPNRAFGWKDQSSNTSRLLVWVWREPAHAKLARLPKDVFALFGLKDSELSKLKWLHSLSRNETLNFDEDSTPVFAAIRTLIEAHIVRIVDGNVTQGREEIVTRALQWMETHITTRQPLARLSDYLGVSPATVQRIFQERLGTSVTKTIAELRRREADRMLASPGTSIKEVAYQLGYRHPHDFSRAYQKHVGRPPRVRG